jgi:hypothetical protein
VPVKIDSIISGYTGDSIINLGGGCMLRLISHGKKLEAQVLFTEKTNNSATSLVFNDNTVFNNTSKEIIAFSNHVKLKWDDTFVPSGTIINKYIIIGRRVIKFL